MKIVSKLWIGIAVLIVLSPLGLLGPVYFKAGSAWGEWGLEEIKSFIGYVPKGLEKLSSLWRAPMQGYAPGAGQEGGLPHSSFAYIVSAVLGVSLVVLLVFLTGKMLLKKED